MAAKHSLNSHLFSDILENYHGVTIDQALSGWAVPPGSRSPAPPEEYDEVVTDLAKFQGRPVPPPRVEVVGDILANPRPINDIVHDWMMNHTLMGVGTQDVAEKARDLRDLSNEIRGGRVADIPLYRGSDEAPATQVAKAPLRPLSFSEDHHVGRIFASGGGRVFKVPEGSVRGIRVPDYVERQRTVGPSRRPEREWLIDPDTIIGRS